MWIDEASEDVLRTWVKHSPTMKLVSLLDGTILWANPAFCEWSQYTLSELRKMTWMQISVPDKNLEADIDETKRLDAYNPSYTVKKQYIPKSAAPEWGQLTVMRYPLTGDIQCCLCTWEPLKNGTAKAFSLAMDHCIEIDRKLGIMTTEIQTLTKQTDEDKFVLGTIRLVQRHPRIALVFLFIAASVFGLNNIVELLQRTGLVHLPVKIEPQNPQANIPEVARHAEGIAFSLPEVQDAGQSFPRSVSQSEAASGRGTDAGRISVITNGGRFVSVSKSRDDSATPGPVPARVGRTGCSDAGVRCVHGRLGAEAAGCCGGTGVLQGSESGVGLRF